MGEGGKPRRGGMSRRAGMLLPVRKSKVIGILRAWVENYGALGRRAWRGLLFPVCKNRALGILQAVGENTVRGTARLAGIALSCS